MLANNWKGEANIETLPHNIFVSVNEVFNITRLIFLLRCTINLPRMRFAPRHSLEIFLRHTLQNILPAHPGHNNYETGGHQKIPSTGTRRFGQQVL